MAAVVTNLNSIIASTLAKYGKTLHDNVFKASPLLYWLKEGGRQKPVEGGLQIIEPIEFGTNSTFDWRHPKATIPLVEQDPFTYAAFDWKYIDGAIVIFWDDERKNRGQAQIFDYAEKLIQNAEKTLKDKLCSGVYADGSPATELDGLEAIVASSGTYGGLSRTTYPDWASIVLATSEAYTIDGGTDGGLRNLYDSCPGDGGDDAVDLIITTKTLWQKHNAKLGAQQRFEDPKMAEAGYRNLMFDNAPIVWDRNCPTGTVYALNSNHLNLRPDSLCAESFIKTESHQAENQLARSILLVWTGNLTCTNPRFQGKMTGKS